MAKKQLTYRDAGVDIDVSNDLEDSYVRLMKSTHGPQVIRNEGGFGGLFRLRGAPGLFDRRYSDPVLVSGTDGVGTKLKIAFAMDKHDTVGIDLVAMSVNDVLVQGAEPLFFLDYAAAGKVEKKVLEAIVGGVAEGCRQANCALLGGETAELPGFYREGEYDLAGFAVGVVERRKLVTGATVKEGDCILGLASSGIHSNGYSLVRKALLEVGGLRLDDTPDGLNCTLGEELLRPTRIYCRSIVNLMNAYRVKKAVKGMVHVTGGGLVENIPRMLPASCDAEIRLGSWVIPPIFNLIAKTGGVQDKEMYRVFNMGIGYVIICEPHNEKAIQERLAKSGEICYQIGRVVPGTGKVKLVRK